MNRGKWPPGATRRWEWVAAVQPAVQLWGEAYVGLVYWTSLTEFVRGVYWFQLNKMGLAMEVVFLAYLFTPAIVLAHPMLRGHLQGHMWSRPLLLLCGLVGIGGQFFWGPLMRVAFSATSVGILGIYVLDGLWAISRARRRRSAFGMVGGIILLQMLRWVTLGPNPLVAGWWGFFLLGFIPSVGTAALLLTEDVAQWEAEVWDDQPANNLESDSEEDEEDLEGISLLAINRPQLDNQEGHDIESTGRHLKEVRGFWIHEQHEAQETPRASSGTPRASPRKLATERRLSRDMVHSPARLGVQKHTVSPLRSEDHHLVIDDGDVRRWGEGEEVPWVQADGCGTDSDVENELPCQRRWRFSASVALRTLQMGVGSGCLLFLTHWLFTAPTTLARWLGISVIWGGPLAMCMLGVGMIIAAEAARSIWLKRVHGLFAWLVALVGAMMMMWSTPWAVTGAMFIVLMLPSMWVMMARNIVGVYSGVGLAMSSVVYLGLVVWSTALVAYEFMPGCMALRGTRGLLLGCAVAGIGLGLGRGPEVTGEERRACGAKLGIARLTWGSGVPGRQALSCLMGVVGIVVVIGLSMRLHSGPSWGSVDVELRVLNFNVHQGFSRAGNVNYDSIYDMLNAEQPHVTMLQETDTMHIVHGNLDLIDFWATKLKLYSLYAPATKADTWGCAMLSTAKLTNFDGWVLPSPHGENACFQKADLKWQEKTVRVMNTHFGVQATDIELQAATLASMVDVSKPLILAGDFNMAPLTDAYNITIASGVLDALVSQNGPWKGSSDRDPGAGLVFSLPPLNCTSVKEPQYDQDKTSDGDPLVATFNFV